MAPKADKHACPGMATGEHKIVRMSDGVERCQGCLVPADKLPKPPEPSFAVKHEDLEGWSSAEGIFHGRGDAEAINEAVRSCFARNRTAIILTVSNGLLREDDKGLVAKHIGEFVLESIERENHGS